MHPTGNVDRLDCGGCLSSVLYWLPFNEVLRAPCSLLGIAKSPVCPWVCMGKTGAFSVVPISHPFPYDRLSQTLHDALGSLHCSLGDVELKLDLDTQHIY